MIGWTDSSSAKGIVFLTGRNDKSIICKRSFITYIKKVVVFCCPLMFRPIIYPRWYWISYQINWIVSFQKMSCLIFLKMVFGIFIVCLLLRIINCKCGSLSYVRLGEKWLINVCEFWKDVNSKTWPLFGTHYHNLNIRHDPFLQLMGHRL